MSTKEVTITEQEPGEVVLAGRAAAKELTAIVSSREKRLVLGGKQYLFFEDWQTIGKFYGVTAKITNTEELREQDTLVGFLAHAVAVTNEHEISAADGECTRDEPNWREKPRFQLRSMAQTRACAKALRNCLGWVAVLAGYEATPAEELVDNVRKPSQKTRKPEAQATQVTAEESQQKDGFKIPETIQALYNWVASHGKEFTRTWTINNLGWSEEEIRDKPKEAYYALLELKPEWQGLIV